MKVNELLEGAKEANPIVREKYSIDKESKKSIKVALKQRNGCFLVSPEKARKLFGVPEDSKSDIKSIISHANAESINSFYKVGRRIIKQQAEDGKEAGEEVWVLIMTREHKAKEKATEETEEEKLAEITEEKPAIPSPNPEEAQAAL